MPTDDLLSTFFKILKHLRYNNIYKMLLEIKENAWKQEIMFLKKSKYKIRLRINKFYTQIINFVY